MYFLYLMNGEELLPLTGAILEVMETMLGLIHLLHMLSNHLPMLAIVIKRNSCLP